MVKLLTSAERRVSEELQKLFGGSSECLPDAAIYPSRKDLDEVFRSNRGRAINAAQTVDDGYWDDAAPEGGLPKEFFPHRRFDLGHDGYTPLLALGSAADLP